MSVDKLVDSSQLDSDLTSVANAIRTKGGTSAQLAFPAGFVSAVQAIPTGTTPTGTKQISITANGTTTEDVTNYANAQITVNVPVGYVAADWLDVTKPVGAIVSSVKMTRWGGYYLLSSRKNVTSVFLTETTIISESMFQLSGIKYLVAPKATEIYSKACYQCSALLAADILSGLNKQGNVFEGSTKMNVLVLRNTSLVSLYNINIFNNTPFASGKAGGTLYVPQALIASYQAATNWSTILGYANNSIQAIEGSIYETQYVDGTPIPTT